MARNDYDVLVIGAGHAGIEASLAATRLGASCALLTENLDSLARMSCNPAIGGVGKGHIVREIDALGGAMGRVIDATAIQFRMLNVRKGPAMHGPRAQADKRLYQDVMKQIVEEMLGLDLRQETVNGIVVENGEVVGVRSRDGTLFRAKSVVICCGTFLRGILHFGTLQYPGGRAGEPPAVEISQSLEQLGIKLLRFKTGTPARINGLTIDYSQLECQKGDEKPVPFSFLNDRIDVEQIPCWMTYTNEKVHQLIREHLHESPVYSGQIESSGPRYCPSIETKITRFGDKERHQLYLEPEGRSTHEVYINGLSTSFSREIQDKMVSLITGLEDAKIMRYAYAIEYDYAPPNQLFPSLETRKVKGLFLAGQVNGTTGYEEAAAQGLIAGTNAALRLTGREPFVPRREQAYIGVMLDDLVTRGVDEPYRMFTSRAEYRLLLRADNADRRLTPIGYKLGLVDSNRMERLQAKEEGIKKANELLNSTHDETGSMMKFLRRPEVEWDQIVERIPALATLDEQTARQVVIDTKYDGYIQRQTVDIERGERLAQRSIPIDFDFNTLVHLRAEAREKFSAIRPLDLGQAGRITGITPADIAVLMVALDRNGNYHHP